jgi:uncharacterized protein YllA (UPF0747 family)
MRFEDLPGIPPIWSDFLRRGVPALPFPGTMQELAACAQRLRDRPEDNGYVRLPVIGSSHAPKVSENIQRLRRPDAVIVVADLYPGLLGGPISQILKCLTAIKICELLIKSSCNAVPVAWMHATSPPGFSVQPVSFLDDNTEIHSFEFPAAAAVSRSNSRLLVQIADFGKGAFDTESLAMLHDSFSGEEAVSSATARLFSGLMRDLGMVVVDPSIFPAQSDGIARVPVLARVIGPFEIDSFAHGMPDLENADFSRTMIWPQVSATIGDVRSRRTLDRYHLELSHLYRGEREVLERFKRGLPNAGLAKLDSLAAEVEAMMKELGSCFSEEKFLKAHSSCREKILYQIGKLADLFSAAMRSKERTASLRIRKACNLMAPNGRLQERELAGIQIPLSYSLAGLHVLYEKLDILSFEHQIIWMD